LPGSPSLAAEVLETLAGFHGVAEYEYTGFGYFLALHSPDFPSLPSTLSEPFIMGEADGIQSGFVVFVENHALTLECHAWAKAMHHQVSETVASFSPRLWADDSEG
jgi:hypothetical protein